MFQQYEAGYPKPAREQIHILDQNENVLGRRMHAEGLRRMQARAAPVPVRLTIQRDEETLPGIRPRSDERLTQALDALRAQASDCAAIGTDSVTSTTGTTLMSFQKLYFETNVTITLGSVASART
jgi:hypothetical protein